MLLTPAQIKPKSFESRRNFFLFFTRGGCVSCLHACFGARLLPQSYRYPNLSEGADKECPFSGITKSGRVWRKVQESDAQSVQPPMSSAGLPQEVTVGPHMPSSSQIQWARYKKWNGKPRLECVGG